MLLIPRGCVLGHRRIGRNSLAWIMSPSVTSGQLWVKVTCQWGRGAQPEALGRGPSETDRFGFKFQLQHFPMWPWACPPFPLNLSSPIEWDQSHLLRLMWKFRRWYLESRKALSSMLGRIQALSQRKHPFCGSSFLRAHLHTHSINTTTRQWENPEFYVLKKLLP